MLTRLSEKHNNNIHRIDLPRIVLVGENVLSQIPRICKEHQLQDRRYPLRGFLQAKLVVFPYRQSQARL